MVGSCGKTENRNRYRDILKNRNRYRLLKKPTKKNENRYRLKNRYRPSSTTYSRFMTATAIYSLGHELRTFSAVPRPTQHCISPESLNRVLASAAVKEGMSPPRVADNTVNSPTTGRSPIFLSYPQ